ncbi:MAG: four-helix bundle copper-binding protein [Caldilineaceae bacterium]|nr:four-helix bundle copper-binding protein [Caldilineaceae bacterium]
MSNGRVAQMIQTHPQPPRLAIEQLARAVQALNECAAVCTTCADACLAEQHVPQLVQCIRLNQDCADICRTTAAVLARPNNPDPNVLRSLLQTCQAICESCGSECERHAEMHEHCRVCAESCRHCGQLCSELMQSV